VRGVPANMMIIAGLMIALGAIIDDAIVDIDTIIRRLRKAREEGRGRPAASVIFEAMLRVRSPMLYGVLIMVLTVMPVLFLEGVSGAFLQPLAMTYILALVASMIVAMTVTPALSLVLLRASPLQASESPATRMLRGIYGALFGWSVRRARTVLVGVCALIAIGLASVPFLRQESLAPDFKETDLVVRLDGGSGASHPAMSRIATLASHELRSIPGVRNVSAQLGRAITSDRRTNMSSGELWVSIDPSADYDATVAAVRQTIAGYPGLDTEVMTYLQAKVREELSGTSESLVVRVYGENPNLVRSKAEEVRAVLADIDGIVGAQVQVPRQEPTLEIEVDVERAKRHGLKPGDVRRMATSIASGIQVGSLYEEQKVFDVVVLGRPETRDSVSSIRELLIDTPDNGHVRLQEVADLRIAPAFTVINRDAVSRRMDVTATVRGRDLVAVATDVKRALREVEFPLEYRAELLGEYADRIAAHQRMLAFAVAAAVGIFLLLQVLFRSWRLATTVMVCLPVTLLGGALAAFSTTGGVLSFGSTLGFVAVLGVAVRNALMLIAHYRDLEQENSGAFGISLVEQGTRDQSAPVLMTAVTTALVVSPFAWFGNIAGLEIVSPMAVIILGGLVTATLFTLVGLPAIYLLFGRKREPVLDLSEEQPAATGERTMEETKASAATT